MFQLFRAAKICRNIPKNLLFEVDTYSYQKLHCKNKTYKVDGWSNMQGNTWEFKYNDINFNRFWNLRFLDMQKKIFLWDSKWTLSFNLSLETLANISAYFSKLIFSVNCNNPREIHETCTRSYAHAVICK